MIQIKEKKENDFASFEKKEGNFGINMEEMIKAGLQFGHQTFRSHPKMKQFVWGVRNKIHIIDLEKTMKYLEEALDFVQKMTSEGKILMIIGTKIQTKDLVKKIAEEFNLPYVNERWIGGTFTNFDIVKKRIEYFKDLEKKKNEGELEKYTKKERSQFDKELKKMEKKFGGLKNLEKIPDAILVLDMKKDKVAVEEAKGKGVKVIGIADTNIDPDFADLIIPANDDAISSIEYILNKLREVIAKAKLKNIPQEK